MKKFPISLLLCLTLLLLGCLTACIDGDTAKGTIADFLTAVTAEDHEKTAGYLHPDCMIDVKALIEKAEKDYALDFSDGVEILRYTGVESSHYDSKVDGSRYATTCKAKIGDETVEITVEIVDNDGGYGIRAMTFAGEA